MGRCCHAALIVFLFNCSFAGFSHQIRLPSQSTSSPIKRSYHFTIEWKNITRLCREKAVLTVNGQFPGPTIAVNEGDEVEIKVTNNVQYNTTIHWHGIRQFRTAWADGPAYITQCPIRSNSSYTYKFRVEGQRGSFWWHSHLSWQRATIHGAFVVYPRHPFPFTAPIESDIPIVLGEWWKTDVQSVEEEIIKYGGGPNISDAYTINGFPGPLYPCSSGHTFTQPVEHGKTYMLRIVNAILMEEMFFGIANHTLTVVEIEGTYVKPFQTPAIMIAPGQTTAVLFTASQGKRQGDTGTFSMAARPYITDDFPSDGTTTVGFIQYRQLRDTTNKYNDDADAQSISLPWLPAMEDTAFTNSFSSKLRSLASAEYPCQVPKEVDKQLLLTISLNLQDCPPNSECRGYLGKRFAASMNNQSFGRPPVSILEWHYRNLSSLVSLDFPEKPPHPFDYTGPTPSHANMNPKLGTKVFKVAYGTRLELVLQDTSFVHVENHPIHIHGHNFFIVGSGHGNFDSRRDRTPYNLVDPPERNTVAVPSGGWAAIRLTADNPGAWFIHCHIEAHLTWGLASAFLVEDNKNPSIFLPPPPIDLPEC